MYAQLPPDTLRGRTCSAKDSPSHTLKELRKVTSASGIMLKLSVMGFPEELVIIENQKINGNRAALLQRRAEASRD